MRVLLIQSQATDAERLQADLKQAGHVVDGIEGDGEGLRTAGLRQHDLILIDAVAEEHDVADLCRGLRTQGISAPILVASPKQAAVDKIAVLDAGADDYLAKPYDHQELMARLRSLGRRALASQPEVLQDGGLVMNIYEHQVFLEGAPVKLSAKEFALLEFMMRNPRRLLTRTMICQEVWDMNYESGSNVIDVYVSSLRRKVDLTGPQRRIQTVIGSGYRFQPQLADAGNAPGASEVG